jgi:hypothetical protein
VGGGSGGPGRAGLGRGAEASGVRAGSLRLSAGGEIDASRGRVVCSLPARIVSPQLIMQIVMIGRDLVKTTADG